MTLDRTWQPIHNPAADLYLDRSDLDRPTHRRIKIRVPKQYIDEPIVTRPASRHDLEVNILSALLGASAGNDGWFDLQLQGNSKAIEDAIFYLSERDIEIWYDPARVLDGADDR
jgi:ABC-type methionine transport system ATPase subunit